MKKKTSPGLIRIKDLLILGLIILFLVGWMFWSYVIKPKLFSAEEIAYAWVYHDKDLLKMIPLNGEILEWEVEVEHGGDAHVLRIQTFADKTIAVTKSDCPDKVCVNTGKVSMMGQSIACLPNHIFVKIGSENNPVGEGGIDG